MKKTLRFFVIAALSALLSTACGGSSSSPQNATESTLNTQNSQANSSNTGTNDDNSTAQTGTDSTTITATDSVPDTIQEPKVEVAKIAFMDKARQFTPAAVELPKAETYLADANKKDSDAQYVLSLMYRTNTGDIANIVKGKKSRHNANKPYEMFRWSLKASSNGFDLAGILEDPSIFPETSSNNGPFKADKTLSWLNTAASAGIADAEFMLGILYVQGKAVPKDTDKGMELIARAALHDLPSAQYFVGMFYELGIGTDVNKTEALSWLEKAANANNPDASFILALKYLDGIDVAKDPEKAEKYRAQSETHHAWSLLLSTQYAGDFENVCKNSYDSVTMDSMYADDCGGDYDGWDPDLSDAENEKRIFENNAHERTKEALFYSIDYMLAWKWLVQNVNANKYFNANLLFAQMLASSGCHAQDNDDYDKRVSKTRKLLAALNSIPNANLGLADLANASFMHHNDLDYDDDESDKAMTATARKIFKLYQSAANRGYKPAICHLARVYDEMVNPSLLSYDIPEAATDYESKAVELYIKCGATNTAADRLSYKADTVFKTDPAKSVPLYEKAAENGDKGSMYKLAQMYNNGKYVTKNDNKSLEYYNKCVLNPTEQRRITGLCALDLAELTAKTNSSKSTELCQLAYDIFADNQPADEAGKKLAKCVYDIELIPRIEDLQTELENEIALEKGKKLTEFFVYTSIIKPCNKDSHECESLVDKYYKESIPKPLRAITALVIGQKGRVDLDLIKNTYYYLAIYLGKNEKYITRFKESSPIPNAIEDMYDQLSYDVDKSLLTKMTFFTWYLRQIPYAAKDLYNKDPGSKSWDELLKEADKAINSNEQLKTAFGLDPVKYEKWL
ncbi:MAG: SEL1-like repeat protein [Proteobacteria bacterium]|nr:SEL1-like repeat protein [Pseudomonadota bacterium]